MYRKGDESEPEVSSTRGEKMFPVFCFLSLYPRETMDVS